MAVPDLFDSPMRSRRATELFNSPSMRSSSTCSHRQQLRWGGVRKCGLVPSSPPAAQVPAQSRGKENGADSEVGKCEKVWVDVGKCEDV